jgi:hypothetical protein
MSAQEFFAWSTRYNWCHIWVEQLLSDVCLRVETRTNILTTINFGSLSLLDRLNMCTLIFQLRLFIATIGLNYRLSTRIRLLFICICFSYELKLPIQCLLSNVLCPGFCIRVGCVILFLAHLKFQRQILECSAKKSWCVSL